MGATVNDETGSMRPISCTGRLSRPCEIFSGAAGSAVSPWTQELSDPQPDADRPFLRTTLAALANAEGVDPAADAPLVRAGLFGDVERRSVRADDVVSIVTGERDGLHAAAVDYPAARSRKAKALTTICIDPSG